MSKFDGETTFYTHFNNDLRLISEIQRITSHFIFEAAVRVSQICNLSPFALQTNRAYFHIKHTCQSQIIIQIPCPYGLRERDEGTVRLMMMSPLYLCGKPCSTGTHNDTVKQLTLFSAVVNGIMIESRLRISVPWEWECFQFFNRTENSITLVVTIVIHESRNLIGTLRIAEFGPK